MVRLIAVLALNLFNQEELICARDALDVYSVRPGITGLAQIKDIDILKINVQGMELDVLEGFENILKSSNIKVILAEYDYSNRYQSSSTIGDLENFLKKFNYGLFDIALLRRKRIIDHNNNFWFLKIRHGYAIFANKDIIEKT